MQFLRLKHLHSRNTDLPTRQVQRWDDSEQKQARQSTLLGTVLGVGYLPGLRPTAANDDQLHVLSFQHSKQQRQLVQQDFAQALVSSGEAEPLEFHNHASPVCLGSEHTLPQTDEVAQTHGKQSPLLLLV